MKSAMFTADNYTENCAYQCGNSSCATNAITVHAGLGAVCAFIFALTSIIINSGAIISVIISIAIISTIIDIIIRDRAEIPQDVYAL